MKKSLDTLLIEMGARIKSARRAKNWTQVEFAERSRLAQQTISKVEKVGTQDRDTIMKLSHALGLSPAYLQYGIEEIGNLSELAIKFSVEFDELSEQHQRLIIEMIETLQKTKK